MAIDCSSENAMPGGTSAEGGPRPRGHLPLGTPAARRKSSLVAARNEATTTSLSHHLDIYHMDSAASKQSTHRAETDQLYIELEGGAWRNDGHDTLAPAGMRGCESESE